MSKKKSNIERSKEKLLEKSKIIVAKDPKPLLICKHDKDVLYTQNIVTHDGKIPDFLEKDGWELYRVEFESGHNKKWHILNEDELEEKDFKLEKRKTSWVKICKNKFRISLDEYKNSMLKSLETKSFSEREKLIPQYKIDNAKLGVYFDSEKRLKNYTATIQEFVNTYKEAETDINKATTHQKVLDVYEKVEYSTKIVKG